MQYKNFKIAGRAKKKLDSDLYETTTGMKHWYLPYNHPYPNSIQHLISKPSLLTSVNNPTLYITSWHVTSSMFTCSRSRSSASFMFLVWMRRISRRPTASGIPMSTSRSNRPNRRRAGSIELGRLVAAITIT